jgi:hypothetical protein
MRPSIMDGPAQVGLGAAARFVTSDPSRIATARLVRPGVSTHVTDVDQRVVALDFTRRQHSIDVTIPDNPSVVLPGYYMLFVVSDAGVPSVARWVYVAHQAE